MADDLIPPPSPAGKPNTQQQSNLSGSAHGDRKNSKTNNTISPDIATQSQSTESEESLSLRQGRDRGDANHKAIVVANQNGNEELPYRSRFGIVAGLLIGLAGIAVGLAIILGSQGKTNTVDPSWSAWHPTGSSESSVQNQIATRVGDKYRLDNGNEMVLIKSGPFKIADYPFSVVLQNTPKQGDLKLVQGKGVLYTMSGIGPGGSIASGKPSTKRHSLLARQALELALYTFHYVPKVDQVVTLLPPPAGQTGTEQPIQALFFRKNELNSELDRPIQMTLTPKTPTPKTLSKLESDQINSLTEKNQFMATFQQGQDAQAFMVLDPVST